MKLFTFGYEGLNYSQFFSILAEKDVQVLVDVRELPLSRKPGFSKSDLANTAVYCNIEYLHLRSLGCPRDIRHAYRADHDWECYKQQFKQYLGTQDQAIQELVDLALTKRCCLMCYEANPLFCHRSIVAHRAALASDYLISVEHLFASITTRIPVAAQECLAV